MPYSSELEWNDQGELVDEPVYSAKMNEDDEFIEGTSQDDSISSVFMKNQQSGRWEAHSLTTAATFHDAEANVQETLKDLQKLGVIIYIVRHDSKDLYKELRSIVHRCARDNRQDIVSMALKSSPAVKAPKRHVLLYQDKDGQLFNLTVVDSAAGPAAAWSSSLESFSGTQATFAITVLLRSYPCIFTDNIGQLRPSYISFILAIVMTEEISYSWLSASMLCRNMPSVSGHSLVSRMGSDWLRKLMVITLALAGAASGNVQMYMTVGGISLACIILLANLGSRAWYFLKWNPVPYSGPGSPIIGFLCAALAGVVVPYMGHKEVSAGGTRALESVIMSAVVVAFIFILTDIDEVQKLLVVGSELCPQDAVNFGVGVWWTLTLLGSIAILFFFKPTGQRTAAQGLETSQMSPVGHLVPDLPNYAVDPNLVKGDSQIAPLYIEMIVGVVIALGIGGLIIFMTISGFDDEYFGNNNAFEDSFNSWLDRNAS